jgi:hypothetical protein
VRQPMMIVEYFNLSHASDVRARYSQQPPMSPSLRWTGSFRLNCRFFLQFFLRFLSLLCSERNITIFKRKTRVRDST